MDRNTLIGYLLIFAIFMGYMFYTNKNLEEARETQRIEDSLATENSRLDSLSGIVQTIDASKSDEEPDTSSSVAKETAVEELGADDTLSKEITSLPEKIFTMENSKLKLQLSSKGGRVAEVELKDYKTYDSTALLLFKKEGSFFSYTIPLKNRIIRTQELDFEIGEQDENHLVLEHKLVEGGSIRQVYTFNELSYLIDYRLELDGMNDIVAKRSNSFSLDWIVEIPKQEKALDDERNNSTVYYKYKNEKGIDNLNERKDDEEELLGGVQWVSFKQKFFSSTFIAPNGLDESGTEISVRTPQSNDYVERMAANFSIEYGFDEKEVKDFQFYFGPNHYQSLKKMKMGMEKVVPLGSSIIGWVNKFAVIPIFNWLNKYFTNYGLIILLLTLIIKLALIFPMYKIYVSSAKMRLLKPEMDALKEKTGGDMQKFQQEQMKMYKKAGVSPFGGCLPQLIQFPILIAMFRFFPASIELRQKAFLWAEDLSTYDSILELGFNIPFYGSHVSLFTLLMAASTLLYTMFNAQSSAITGQMKYIMYFMPFMLLIWFNSYSSGLSYYYFLANMISFGQNWVFKTFIVDEDKLHKQIEQNKKKKVNVKPSRFQKKLEEMAKKRGIDPKTMKR